MSFIQPTPGVAPPLIPDDRKGRPRAFDLGVACAGLLVLAASGLLARDELAVGERAVFEFVNSWPDVLYVVIWPFMQYGVFVTIPILVVVAMIARRYRLAVAMAVAGSVSTSSPNGSSTRLDGAVPRHCSTAFTTGSRSVSAASATRRAISRSPRR
jgi:hypothetical protein